MEYKNDLAKQFWEDVTKSIGEIEHTLRNGNTGKVDRSIKSINEADIRECVRRAFRDLTVRTMEKNISDTITLDNLAKACCDCPDGFLSLIQELFGKIHSDTAFDIWHEKACAKAIDFLKDTYKEEDCTYGKAQKIVNMTLKSLYALCAAKGIMETYAPYFKHCHVPLDSFTLEWFYRECKKQKKPIVKGHIINWSSISVYGDKDTNEHHVPKKSDNSKFDTYYTYYYYQKIFREWYPADGSITPLQAEFVKWPEIQKEIVAEEFLFVLKGNLSVADKNNYRIHKSYAEKILEIKGLI